MGNCLWLWSLKLSVKEGFLRNTIPGKEEVLSKGSLTKRSALNVLKY